MENVEGEVYSKKREGWLKMRKHKINDFQSLSASTASNGMRYLGLQVGAHMSHKIPLNTLIQQITSAYNSGVSYKIQCYNKKTKKDYADATSKYGYNIDQDWECSEEE